MPKQLSPTKRPNIPLAPPPNLINNEKNVFQNKSDIYSSKK